jgi:hypothetical protein
MAAVAIPWTAGRSIVVESSCIAVVPGPAGEKAIMAVHDVGAMTGTTQAGSE